MKNKLSKRMRIIKEKIDSSMQCNLLDGLSLLKKMSNVKFIESVDIAVNLGIDSRKSDQNIRGNVIMPNGIGRDVFVVVFTQGDYNIELAKNSGADLVGLDDLFDQITTQKLKIDVIIASPDVMHVVAKLGPFLGPRGLMPNLKMGTISQDISQSVKSFKLGQVRYKNDKNGIIHATIGKINFTFDQLKENLEALIASLNQIKPMSCKGEYIKKITISTTMGGSILISRSNFGVYTS